MHGVCEMVYLPLLTSLTRDSIHTMHSTRALSTSTRGWRASVTVDVTLTSLNVHMYVCPNLKRSLQANNLTSLPPRMFEMLPGLAHL